MPPTKRPTIRDVARLAGVSTGAVSQAVNNSGRLRHETRVRILSAADQLGWQPSSAARAVNGIQPMAVGLVVRRDTRVLDEDPFFASFLSGIETVASQHDLAVSLRFVTNQRDEDQAYKTMWSERAVRGFLVTDPRMDDHRLDLLHELEASVVVTGDPQPDTRFSSCHHDSTAAIEHAVSTLRELGHTRLAYVSGPVEFVHSHRRRHLFEEACARVGLHFIAATATDFSLAGGVTAAERLLADETLTNAVAFGSDAMALGALTVFAREGIRVPDDVSMLGFDGIVMGRFTVPTLATIACDYVELGRECTSLLLDRANGAAVERRVLEARWVPGASIGSP